MKLTTMLESRIRESYQIQLFTTFCNQKLTESCRDHFDSQKFQFHVLIVLLGAVRALCFNTRFFLGSFGWKKIADYVMIAQAALLIQLLYFMESLRLRTWPKFSMKILSGNLRLYHTGS